MAVRWGTSRKPSCSGTPKRAVCPQNVDYVVREAVLVVPRLDDSMAHHSLPCGTSGGYRRSSALRCSPMVCGSLIELSEQDSFPVDLTDHQSHPSKQLQRDCSNCSR